MNLKAKPKRKPKRSDWHLVAALGAAFVLLWLIFDARASTLVAPPTAAHSHASSTR